MRILLHLRALVVEAVDVVPRDGVVPRVVIVIVFAVLTDTAAAVIAEVAQAMEYQRKLKVWVMWLMVEFDEVTAYHQRRWEDEQKHRHQQQGNGAIVEPEPDAAAVVAVAVVDAVVGVVLVVETIADVDSGQVIPMSTDE